MTRDDAMHARISIETRFDFQPPACQEELLATTLLCATEAGCVTQPVITDREVAATRAHAHVDSRPGV